MTELEDSTVSKLADFVMGNMPQYTGKKQQISDVIIKHHRYNTLDYETIDKEIVYVIRYNIDESGKICNVLDFCISKRFKNKKLIKYVIAKNWSKFPRVEFLKFRRDEKYPNRSTHFYRIIDLLK